MEGLAAEAAARPVPVVLAQLQVQAWASPADVLRAASPPDRGRDHPDVEAVQVASCRVVVLEVDHPDQEV